MSRRRVIIIGAGPGGLASAMLLAASGCDVTVLERRDRVGGRTSSITEAGYTFDVGPTFFLYPRVLEEVFTACGRNLHDEVQLVRLDPQYHLVFEAGGELKASHNVAQMREMLKAIDPRDAAAFPKFLADNRKKLSAFRAILESPFASPLDLLRPSVMKSALHLRPLDSVHTDLCKYFHDARTRLAFSFQSKYLGMSPFQCPSLFTILSFLEYEYGVWHPIGGCNAVTAAMARVAESMGVDIRLNEAVTSLSFDEQRRVRSVTTSSATYDCDAAVINADFANTMTKLVPDGIRKRWKDKAIGGKRFSCSTFMMYLGVEGTFPDLEHHTIWLAKDYEENLRDIEERHCLSCNPSFYVQNACRTDPSLAPAGHSALYCLLPVSNDVGTIDWHKETPAFRELAFTQMERIGIHNVRDRIRYEKVLTPADWVNDYQLYRGATFNLAHNLGQMLHRRPHNRFEDLANVYLVGGGTHPGSGLPVIFESARISSGLLLDDQKIPYHWPGQTGQAAKYATRGKATATGSQ
ncbi:MAG TPA: phytoene desaturase family protein [Tepidisphaeraceae bacterium]|jgi:phytoene desaturase|nr:phytoene desaturase family protein [Tepidisphaeraceae bacterium]